MAVTVNHVPIAARRSSALSMRTTSRITARIVRPLADCWLIGHCRVCCAMTGRVRSRNWSRSGVDRSLVSFRSALIAMVMVATALANPARAQSVPELRWGGDAEGGAPFVEADPQD